MKRTNINNCKIVGNKINNIIGDCEGSGIAVSYNCVDEPGTGTDTCSSITDSGISGTPNDFMDWYVTNNPSVSIGDYKFGYTTGTPPDPCYNAAGDPLYKKNSLSIWEGPPNSAIISPSLDNWNDLLSWLQSNGCSSVNASMTYSEVNAELVTCYGVGSYVLSNNSPCSCTASESYGCVDPGDGSGDFATLEECLESGCEFNPATDTGSHMILWLQSRSSDMLITSFPHIDKWTDNGSGRGLQFNAGSGLGTATKPTWDGTIGNEWVMFDGGDYLDCPTAITLDTTIDQGWTIAMTVKMEDWDSGAEVVLGDDNSNNSMIKFNSASSVQFKLYNPDLGTSSTKGVTFNNPASLVDNTAYVFVFCVNDTDNDGRLFINNVEQTGLFAFPMGYDFSELQEIGAKNGGQLGMAGGIKEVMVYKKELTDSEVSLVSNYMMNKL
jgi:hypothetical protein